MEKHISCIGRFDLSNPEGPIFAWSGCTIKARFRGRSLAARIKPIKEEMDKNWMEVIVDGKVLSPIRIDRDRQYILAEGLHEGEHEVALVRRTEAFVGELQFLGFVLPDGGQLLDPPEPSGRRIEFIGDSITCGYGNESSRVEDGFQESQENNYIAYGSITARNLKADAVTVAWSGKGMYRNYGGDTIEPIPELYDRTLPERKDSQWDFKSWIPHAVVINLGTNDFAQPGLDHEAYQSAYRKMLHKVRSNYPDAHIFCCIGPIRCDPGEDIKRVVQDFRKQGDCKIYYVEFPLQDVERDGIGGDWHPSAKTHERMAEQLTAEIRDKLGW